MFRQNPTIQFENELANKILVETTQNEFVKRVLHGLANCLRKSILSILKQAVNNPSEFNQKNLQECHVVIKGLATAHSKEGDQYGALLKKEFKDANEIISDPKNIIKLLTALDDALSDIIHIQHMEKLIQALKVMVDLGTAYVDGLKQLHSPRFTTIYNLLWPSPEEMNARISYKEAGQPLQRSVTFGIGRAPGEIIPLSEVKGEKEAFFCGKSVFLTVDIELRLSLMIEEYNSIFSEKNETIRAEKLAGCLKKIENNFGSNVAKKIIESRENDDIEIDFIELARLIEPSSLKLARSERLPFVASISGSAARLLMTLEDLGGFDLYFEEDGEMKREFWVDKPQILTNCFAGFFIRAGHHAWDEVMEVLRRLIDSKFLDTERTPELFKQKIQECLSNNTWVENEISAYGKVGDYYSVLHPAFENIFPQKNAQKFDVLKPSFN